MRARACVYRALSLFANNGAQSIRKERNKFEQEAQRAPLYDPRNLKLHNVFYCEIEQRLLCANPSTIKFIENAKSEKGTPIYCMGYFFELCF